MIYQYSHRLGQKPGGLDPDAKAYIDAVVAAGATVSGTQKNAISDFVKTGKADGWYSSIKRLYLPIWAAASPNAIDMIGGTSGSFVGAVTYSAGYVQGNGASGLFRFNGTPSGLAMTNASGFGFSLCNVANTIDGAHFGVLEGITNRCSLQASGSSLFAEYVTSATFSSVSMTKANQTGIMCFSRTSTTSLVIYQRKTSGFSSFTPSTTTETGTVPSVSVCAMARGRSSGVPPDLYSNGGYGAYGIGLGLTQTNVENFTLALKNMWETCTGLTLP